MPSSDRPVTLLRVRRSRDAVAAPTMRLEGIQTRKRGRIDGMLADLNLESTKKQVALWKKLEPTNKSILTAGNIKSKQSKKRSYRIVDAAIVSSNDGQTSNKKRRTLTLKGELNDKEADQWLSTTLIKKKILRVSYPVLDPAQRLVDDSLKRVFAGEISVLEHIQFVQSDDRLNNETSKWLLSWSNVELGNVMHACALWNDVEALSYLLNTVMDKGNTYLTICDSDDVKLPTSVLDSEGYTPYQAAHAVGHEQICELLEAHGQCGEYENDGNYIYDVYQLDESEKDAADRVESNNNENDLDDNDDDELVLQCEGGYGYWNEDGELIFDIADPKRDQDLAEMQEGYDDGDVDSNAEDHEGNDYPEEGYWEKDSDSSSDDGDDQQFRNRPAVHFEDQTFDAAYGLEGKDDSDYDSQVTP